MLKKIIILFLGIFLLSSCTDNFRNYFQRSANNKLFDVKGAKGGKRKPVYNNKYIALAKKNIVEDNIDYDNDVDDNYDNDGPLISEKIDNVKRNREMYLNMIKSDIARQKAEFSATQSNNVMTLSKANKKVRKDDSYKEKKIEEELNQIKAMLKETKRDITKYTCPNATVNQNYVPPVTNYEHVNYPPIKNSNPYNNTSKVKQKFIREDDDDTNNACSI
ncbi:hypothetical protein [Rickettsia typhi]|uniref:Uncharacterized lipoprotein RT0399 n=2 Tax=Rickettsia typhi TaxID=785 RepID=Y399_RICTY|nr:hypothetical protein [Rickettsia typhi]Q68WW6.1 RecName: Full=Uncharacterized lipoprotein RT0399; Flags: Precursor [Rickettsia typhi str. Wilmington]AAU03876.1 rickettsial conserved hypothetical protein [Rickettsia typhi str. Wilmington]AFE54258.1 hypothetical protein RTTH1527_01965 [Rickettsia typhi str. TH1527]AFE55098.1 hypothetical protein RTB9991CWPP_01975 [Rickettsia typhi str. B9991CWPP]